MRSKSKLLLILAIVFFVSVTITAFNEINPTVKADSFSSVEQQFDETVPKLMKKYNVPGTAVALVRKGEVDWVKGYGWADKSKEEAVTKDTVFQVASNSKSIAAWGVMKLVEKGKLDLDTPAERYLTRWHLPKTDYDNNEVTIRRILSHTAGLSQGGYAGYFPAEEVPSLENSLSGRVKGVKELKITKKPGKKYKYSGGGYTLLQLITEEVSGKPFSKYMKEEVLEPLGMMSSSYEWEPGLKTKTATPYDVSGNKMPNYLFAETAAAGLYTTAPDLARFVAANLDSDVNPAGRNVLKQSTLSVMRNPVKKDYGLGCIIKDLPDGRRLIYHGGTNRGWRSQYVFIPENRSGLVVLTNSENGENLHRDLMSLWAKWETGHYPDFRVKNILLRTLIRMISLALVLLMIVYIRKVLKSFSAGKRHFIFSGKHSLKRAFFISIVQAVALVAFLALWMIAFYTGVFYNGWTFASFAPSGFIWLTITVVLWSILLTVTSLTRKTDFHDTAVEIDAVETQQETNKF
ncbi:MAG: serine hydrolase [Clostridia bacterium]|nr:serine hydrolase [Clostridia bacterium]